MPALFNVQFVTPERVLFDGEADTVILRTAEGDLAFLAGHTPLVGTVQPGVVRIHHLGADWLESAEPERLVTRVAVHGGFVRTARNHTVILAKVAELASEIDVDRARRALDAAEAALAGDGGAPSSSRGAAPGPSGAEGVTGAGGAVAVASEDDPAAARLRALVRLEAAGGEL